MPLFNGTQQGYYEQSQSFVGAGAGNLTVGPVTTAAFATRPTQQVDIVVFINGIEINKNSYSYNGTNPGDTTPDDSYDILFNNTNPNTNVQAADGSPLAGLIVLFREVLATEQFGNYQYVSLENIINNFIISYTGPGKLIPDSKRTEVIFHARRCLQEFAYETLKSKFIVEASVLPATYTLPSDFVTIINIEADNMDFVQVKENPGQAEYAIDYTIDYMSQREAFGTKINKFQALRHTMVEHAADVEHCKIFNYAAVARLDKGEYVVKEATMAKLKSTKVADETIYSCLQMLGGYGYMEEYPLARLFRDSRLGPIGGGTSEILKEILSKMIIDKQDYKPAVK